MGTRAAVRRPHPLRADAAARALPGSPLKGRGGESRRSAVGETICGVKSELVGGGRSGGERERSESGDSAPPQLRGPFGVALRLITALQNGRRCRRRRLATVFNSNREMAVVRRVDRPIVEQ